MEMLQGEPFEQEIVPQKQFGHLSQCGDFENATVDHSLYDNYLNLWTEGKIAIWGSKNVCLIVSLVLSRAIMWRRSEPPHVALTLIGSSLKYGVAFYHCFLVLFYVWFYLLDMFAHLSKNESYDGTPARLDSETIRTIGSCSSNGLWACFGPQYFCC